MPKNVSPSPQELPAEGGRVFARWTRLRTLWYRWQRTLLFVLVGGTGVLLSFALLWAGINIAGLDQRVAYFLQALVTIEYNFFLNRYLTWRDRRDETSLLGTWLRFHAVKVLLTIPLGQLVFTLLTLAGLHYSLANALCIVIMMVVNYVVSHRFVFKSSTVSIRPSLPTAATYQDVSVSFVIPVKNNADTIRQTVAAIDALEWDGTKQVIVVGSHDDTSWGVIADYIASGLVLPYEVDVVRTPGLRDANAKRSFGLQQATGEILAVIDSDVILPKDWLRTVAEHFENGYAAVGGPVVGLGGGFWTRYIDQNPVASKTPRMKGVTVIDAKSIRFRKPPVTANFACVRILYEDSRVGGPNVSFRNSYEDYEWFSRIVRAGYSILRDEALGAVRYHREGLKPLLREYTRSGKGCADLIVTHPACGFAQTRVMQIAALVMVGAVAIASVIMATLWTVVLAVAGYIVHAAICCMRVRRVEGALYPLLSAMFTGAFLRGVLCRFVGRGFRRPAEPVVTNRRAIVLSEEMV